MKDQTKKRMYDVAEEVAALCNDSKVCCIINDSVDIALVTGVAGVHLGQSDFPVEDARRLLPEKIIGFSSHNQNQFADANHLPVDYVAIGPIFATKTKANTDPALGIHEIANILKLKSKPVVAIGGIQPQHIADLISLGIDGIAVISALYVHGKVYENTARMMEFIKRTS